MRSRRIPTVLVVLPLGIALTGCSDRATPTTRAEFSPASAQSTKGEDIRDALRRTEAELAASRAQVDELKHMLNAQARQPDGPSLSTNSVPTPSVDFTIFARQRLHDCSVSSVAFSPDGKHVATADVNGRVIVSSANNLEPAFSVEAITGGGVHNGTFSVRFSPDGKLIAVGSEDRTVWVWRAGDGHLVKRVRGHEAPVEHVFFLPDNSSGLSFDQQGIGVTWSVDDHLKRQLIPNRRIRHAALTPDGKMLVWSDGSRTLCGPPEQKEAARLGPFADSVAITSDGSLVAKGSNNFCVEIWDVRYETKKWGSVPQSSKVRALAFAPNDKRLVSLSSNTVSIWDVRTGDEMRRVRVRSKDFITRLAVSPDGRTIALANLQGMVILARLPE